MKKVLEITIREYQRSILDYLTATRRRPLGIRSPSYIGHGGGPFATQRQSFRAPDGNFFATGKALRGRMEDLVKLLKPTADPFNLAADGGKRHARRIMRDFPRSAGRDWSSLGRKVTMTGALRRLELLLFQPRRTSR